MYSIINQNIDLLLESPLLAKDIPNYSRLVQAFKNTDVSRDSFFQSEYRNYWKMNAARLDDTFYHMYFDLLQKSRLNNDLNVGFVAESLYRDNREQGLQFSFASKLVHMIMPQKPIYDSMVASFFFFLPPTKVIKRRNENSEEYFERDLNTRLTHYRQFFDFLINEYARIIDNNLLQQAIDKFRNVFPQCSSYTNERIIDSLIWHFVDAVRNRQISFY